MEFLTDYKISAKYSRMRIDRLLSMRYSYLSRSEWQKEISRGKLSCNGNVVTKLDMKIKTGDVLSYAGRDAAEPDVNENFSVLYEDEYLLGINKPGNLPVHPAGIFYHNTLLSFLRKSYPMTLHLLHRLDRETSGVVLIAKDARVASHIQKNFSAIEKKYIALVHGMPDNDEFMIDMPIDCDASSGIEHKRAAFEGARQKACTEFVRLASFNGVSLMKAMPRTGRQHQIRVHLKHAGFPIVGDKLYGPDESVFREFVKNGFTDDLMGRLGFRRSALHSRSILLHHPVLQKKILIKAPLAEDMRQFIIDKRNSDV
ncbi:MAG: RluA family pseudouridine synthase [Spirochaetes bacterium]|nr:RluA family pseudouridine synthase [Spirochaetota bacterium]